MTKALKIALLIHVVIMASIFFPPTLATLTGKTVYLETQRVDPRSLFRGDYVILRYPIENAVPTTEATKYAADNGSILYVVVTTDKPAEFVRSSTTKPHLTENEACIAARVNQRYYGDREANTSIRFPQISQFFVAEGKGKDIERDLSIMAAEIRTTKSCNAVLVDLDYL